MGVKLLQSVLPSPSSDGCVTHAVSSVASRFHQANVQISAARVMNPKGSVRRPSGLAPTHGVPTRLGYLFVFNQMWQ